MALWRYTVEHEDGRRDSNVLAAGNGTAARERAERNARAVGARLVEGPTLVDPVRGSL